MSAAVRVGYKKTEVGVIPGEWSVQQLKNLNFDISDGNYSSKYPKASDFKPIGVPFIRANNIRGMTVSDDDMRFISAIQHNELLKGHLKAGDVLITTRGDIGQIALVPDSHIGSNINAQIVRINTKNQGVDFLYFAYAMISQPSQEQIDMLQTGSALKQLPVGKFIQLWIALPPASEQRAIAATLSDVDALLAKLDALIAKKRDLKVATMQQLLTGLTRLTGFSGEWVVKRLGDLLKVRHGRSQHEVVVTGGIYPILATGGEIGRTNVCLYDKPSVLIGRKGTIDKPQFQDSPFWTVDTLFYTELFNSVHPKFIYFKFLMIDWRSYNEASGVPSLNASTIENIEVVVPKLEEQTAIAQVLSDMDAELTALEARRDKTRALKQGMMQELLTGRIRLV